jgi:plasmid stabilization system protein ParE
MKRMIRLAARDDIAAATEFYSSESPQLAADFVAEIDRVLSLVERFPRAGREFPAAGGYGAGFIFASANLRSWAFFANCSVQARC